jgi:hypothetical protein
MRKPQDIAKDILEVLQATKHPAFTPNHPLDVSQLVSDVIMEILFAERNNSNE